MWIYGKQMFTFTILHLKFSVLANMLRKMRRGEGANEPLSKKQQFF